jgi:hypothetical protein
MHIVFDDDLRDLATPDPLEQIDGVVGVGARHPRCGLIEQQEFWFLRQAHREFQAALVPARKAIRNGVSLASESDILKHVLGTVLHFGLLIGA